MELAEFITLIESCIEGKPDKASLNEDIVQFLAEHPQTTPAQLLEQTQAMLTSGRLSPKDFRLISEVITELNIQRALDEHAQSSSMSADPNNIDETVIVPPPNDHAVNDAVQETLIESRSPELEKTLIIDPATAEPRAGTDGPKNTPKATNKESGKPKSVLKNRFELLEIIGRGGMGQVYKARDLVKVQARDSNPYVAIKVLSEKFKKHSRAFIALQREASKSQRLAHPNIATVYDFDHDGDTIYMTMELLDGQPFDKIISNQPEGGLPKTLALRYVEELCNGLAYAHKQNLIHCDLKPANIFLCDSGPVKLLDFGITRAIKKEKQKKSEETLFDPATLKALTPAYASVEMFRGEPPDPRDDIYALACVAYELLTGGHPYKKVAAHKALELNLKPTAVKGLSRSQQKALFNALELERARRTPSVEEFIRGMKPASGNRTKKLAFGGIAIVLMGAALLVKPIQTDLQEKAQLQVIQSIKSGDQQLLEQMLDELGSKDENSRAYLTSILRKEIITYYQEKINTVINAKQKRYDFPEAMRLLNEVRELYPDSASLAEADRQLNAKKDSLIDTLISNLEDSSGKKNARILEILREADPSHALLQNKN